MEAIDRATIQNTLKRGVASLMATDSKSYWRNLASSKVTQKTSLTFSKKLVLFSELSPVYDHIHSWR